MTPKSELGKTGEDQAVRFLKAKGYVILRRNYRQQWGEIDLIARSPEGTLVFVEVKTMRKAGEDSLVPEDQVTSGKLRKLRRVCETFLSQNESMIDKSKGWRIDLVALTLNEEDFIIKHYENI